MPEVRAGLVDLQHRRRRRVEARRRAVEDVDLALVGLAVLGEARADDAEALFATPDRRLGIITKEADGIALVYLSVAALDPAQPAVDLVQVATIDLNAVWLSGQQLGARQLRVTAADLSPDGTQLAVRTTAGAWVWTVPGNNVDAASNGLWAEALRQPPVQTLSFPEMTQAEAIAFDA
jgi:hypothetical protein